MRRRGRSLAGRVVRQQGRRGGVLTLFGIVWMLIGVGVIAVRTDRFSRPGPGGPLQFADHWWTGLFWVVGGLIALANGLLRRRFSNEDAPGYAALIVPPTLWMFLYAWSFVTWAVTTASHDEVFGRASAIIGLFVFGILVAVVRIIAKWPDDFDVEAAVPPTAPELAALDAERRQIDPPPGEGP